MKLRVDQRISRRRTTDVLLLLQVRGGGKEQSVMYTKTLQDEFIFPSCYFTLELASWTNAIPVRNFGWCVFR